MVGGHGAEILEGCLMDAREEGVGLVMVGGAEGEPEANNGSSTVRTAIAVVSPTTPNTVQE